MIRTRGATTNLSRGLKPIHHWHLTIHENQVIGRIDRSVNRLLPVLSNIYGVAPDGTHVAATITSIGSIVSLTGLGLTQELAGIGVSPNNSGLGNATISFGSAVITDVFFNFGNTAGAPRYQDIAIGDISFTPVPEINPAAASAVSCVIALGLAVFGHRRAAKARRHLQP